MPASLSDKDDCPGMAHFGIQSDADPEQGIEAQSIKVNEKICSHCFLCAVRKPSTFSFTIRCMFQESLQNYIYEPDKYNIAMLKEHFDNLKIVLTDKEETVDYSYLFPKKIVDDEEPEDKEEGRLNLDD